MYTILYSGYTIISYRTTVGYAMLCCICALEYTGKSPSVNVIVHCSKLTSWDDIARKARSGSNQLGNLSYLSRSSRPGTKLFPRAWLSIWVCQKIIMHPHIPNSQWMRISFPIKVAICGYSPIFRQTHFNPRNSS